MVGPQERHKSCHLKTLLLEFELCQYNRQSRRKLLEVQLESLDPNSLHFETISALPASPGYAVH